MSDRCFVFKLYVIGAPQKRLVGERLRSILAELLTDPGYKLEVVDLLQHPEIAERENIIATPLLVRTSPSPNLYITGDFSDLKRLKQLLVQRG